jgi:hypothetical protein
MAQMRTTKLSGRLRPRSIHRSAYLALAALIASLGLTLGPAAASAPAAVPSATDVVFVFDTSGSMEGVLTETQEQIATLIGNLKATLPNVEFAIANVEDLPGYISGGTGPTETEEELEKDPEKPWRLFLGLTSEQAMVEAAIANLGKSSGEGGPAHAGGDLPEAYGRALYESATNPNVGWRAGARHEIVLIGDNVPHAPNLNEGIPASLQFTEAGNDAVEAWPNTGEELGGKWGIPGTQWKPGESLEFHKTLQRLLAEEKPLAMVDYKHTSTSEKSNYLHYWEYWAAATGGQAITTEEGSHSLDAKLLEVIKASAEGVPPCPPGYTRTATTPCTPLPPAPPPPPTSPPVEKHHPVVFEGTGEVEWEVEFPEPGEAEFEGEVGEGAELARVHGLALIDPFALAALNRQQGAGEAKAKHHRGRKKPKRCKKGFKKKNRRCVSTAAVHYGKGKLAVPSAGVYKIRIKPSGKVLRALRRGRTAKVRLELAFTPAGTTVHIAKTASVRLHLKLEKKHKKARKGKGRKRRKK